MALISPFASPVLLYVRKEGDEVFDALMLHAPTLNALMEAVRAKKCCLSCFLAALIAL